MAQWMFQTEQWLRQIEQWVRQQPAEQLYIAVAVVVIASTLLILLHSFNRSKANTIIIAGLSGSGKTVLFYQLRDGSSHQGTVTSMEPNDDMFVLHSEVGKKDKTKPVRVVDLPGHSRLRPKLDEFLPQAAGLIFVVDALDFLPNCRVAAEYLYDILTKASVVKKKIPVLILCNKTDKVTAHSKEFIRKQLEKEMFILDDHKLLKLQHFHHCQPHLRILQMKFHTYIYLLLFGEDPQWKQAMDIEMNALTNLYLGSHSIPLWD